MNTDNQNFIHLSTKDDTKSSELYDDALRKAKGFARDYNIRYKDITFIKEWEGWYIFAFDLKDKKKNEAIMIRNTYPQGLLCKLLSFKLGDDTYYFTEEEIDVWRYRLLESLFEIVKRPDAIEAGFSKEWAVREMVGKTEEHLIQIMPFNTPEGYADILTM
jgi:hypothetical protein